MIHYLFVDGNNLAMRSVHAAQTGGQELSVRGTPTKALMIFVNSLAKLLGEQPASHVAVAWDGVSKYRRSLLPAYKANRKAAPVGQRERDDAFLLMWAFLDAAGIPSYRHDDYEADDLISAWWVEPTEGEMTIASGDKDFLQLCGPNPHGVPTRLLRFAPGASERWDALRVEEEFGFEPRCWPLVTALTGDTSDNIDGVPGIGPKRAVKLLARHDWNLIEALEEIPEHREKVERNLKLVDLRSMPLAKLNLPRTVELPRYGTEAGLELEKFFLSFELAVLHDRFRNHTLWSRPPMPGRSMTPVRTTERSAP